MSVEYFFFFFFFEIENWREIVDEFFGRKRRGKEIRNIFIYRRIELEIFFLLIENSFEVEVESWSDQSIFFFDFQIFLYIV